ncbi:MAG: protein-disulfide reductase DsbD family protein [Fidelibacterota bacterium]
MLFTRTFFFLLAGLSTVSPVKGQVDSPVKVSVKVEPARVRAGEVLTVLTTAAMEPEWHIYAISKISDGPVPSRVTVRGDGAVAAVGATREPEPVTKFDEGFLKETHYHEGTVTFETPVKISSTLEPGGYSLSVDFLYQACDPSICYPPKTETFEISLTVEPGEARPERSDIIAAVSALDDDGNINLQAAMSSGVGAYLLLAVSMGLLALLTPCVFPMIPITVSFFTKREATKKRAVAEAGLYGIGIILTFTLIGFILTFLFGAGGINRLAASPWVNTVIALIFILFAFSLFGLLDIRLPSSWINAINRKSSTTGGVMGIVLMAFTFSLTTFTCTVPFVGTVMVAALHGDVMWSLMGVTAFAAVFAAPFLVLAMFPSWLRSLPKSGNWMNAVKITMGFLELAAALKFISNVDLVFQWEIITRPIFIIIWLAIAVVTAYYLLGKFRFPHETATESVGAVRVLSSIFFLATSFYLLRGLFGFPLGELDAFLPPRDYGNSASISLFSGAQEKQEKWLADYETALSVSRRDNRAILIDFTGYTCTNCRWMESNIFPRPEVQELFDQFVLVRLYTDGTKPEHKENLKMEQERFGTIALPLYAIMSPQDEIIATFPGLTRDVDKFVAFLSKGLVARQFVTYGK